MDQHRKKVVADRRKNNIFGEVTDRVLNPLLGLGCTAGFYNPNETMEYPVTIFARSDELYVVKVLYQDDATVVPVIDGYSERLISIAKSMGAIPIYAIHRHYCLKTKFYSMDGKRVQHM